MTAPRKGQWPFEAYDANTDMHMYLGILFDNTVSRDEDVSGDMSGSAGTAAPIAHQQWILYGVMT